MKCNMPRTGSGLQCCYRIRWLPERNLFIGMKYIYMFLICSQVCFQEEPFVRRKNSGMYMSRLLSGSVRTFSELPDDLHGRCQGTITVDRQRCQAAGTIIRYKNPFGSFIFRNITG